MLALHDAEHAETAPDAPCLVISPLTCSLVGTTLWGSMLREKSGWSSSLRIASSLPPCFYPSCLQARTCHTL